MRYNKRIKEVTEELNKILRERAQLNGDLKRNMEKALRLDGAIDELKRLNK